MSSSTSKQDHQLWRLEPAHPGDGPAVLSLYRSLIGLPGATWTEDYPGLEEVEGDLARGSLWCLWGPDGSLWGAASLGEPDEELLALSCWTPAASLCELSRVAVREDLQGKGLGEAFVRRLLQTSAEQGRDMAYLIVGPGNRAALRLYQKLGFVPCGQARLYEMDWVCMEKRLP